MDAGLTWSRAMTRTHQDPSGFSMRHLPEEHFTTSVQIGDHIARRLLRLCEEFDDPMIVDVGAGGGVLLRQLLALGHPRERLLGVDVRPRPADLDVPWIQGVAPDCVPRVSGVLFAHEFLDDIGVDVVRDGWVLGVDGQPLAPADQADLDWLRQWAGGATGVVGRHRDAVWLRLVDRVDRGVAIAVDFPPSSPVGHRAGRRVSAATDGDTDVCAGVELRSCRAATGGRIIPQHRVLADLPASSVQERAELSVLRDRAGLGGFDWLFTPVPSVGSRV